MDVLHFLRKAAVFMWVYVGTGTTYLGSYHQKLSFSSKDRCYTLSELKGKMKLTSCSLLCVATIVCGAFVLLWRGQPNA
jgi:hypothetical protein